jgi:hypothetical protein
MPIDALDAAISQHVHAIQSTAAASPAGGGPAWDGLLRHYGVPALDARERETIARQMRLSRGATPAEVRRALEALVAWAQRELDRLALEPAAAASPAMARVRSRLGALLDAETAAYERSIGLAPPPPAFAAPPAAPAAPSLASIFANAQQTSKEVPWANAKYKQVATLTCVHCGGPQEQPQDFMCRYCRRPIAGTIERTH